MAVSGVSVAIVVILCGLQLLLWLFVCLCLLPLVSFYRCVVVVMAVSAVFALAIVVI